MSCPVRLCFWQEQSPFRTVAGDKGEKEKKLIQKKKYDILCSIKYEQSGVRTGLCPCPGEKGNR